MTTFNVDDVQRREFSPQMKKASEKFPRFMQHGMEVGDEDQEVAAISVTGDNGFVDMIHMAFANHLPVKITPDDIWLTIAQGVASLVRDNPEEARSFFVNHQGKEKIVVRRNGFMLGMKNPWLSVFPQFKEKVKEFMGTEKVDKLCPRFSTTTEMSHMSSVGAFLTMVDSFFEFRCRTCCGIPQITLAGTLEDWENIYETVDVFLEPLSVMKEWRPHLLEVLHEFVETKKGNINVSFWQSIYKESGGSGGPYVRGWINTLFAKAKDTFYGTDEKRWTLWKTPYQMMSGMTTQDFPSSLSKLDYIWDYNGTEIPMAFYSGIIGFRENSEGFLETVHSWAVENSTFEKVKENPRDFLKEIQLY